MDEERLPQKSLQSLSVGRIRGVEDADDLLTLDERVPGMDLTVEGRLRPVQVPPCRRDLSVICGRGT